MALFIKHDTNTAGFTTPRQGFGLTRGSIADCGVAECSDGKWLSDAWDFRRPGLSYLYMYVTVMAARKAMWTKNSALIRRRSHPSVVDYQYLTNILHPASVEVSQLSFRYKQMMRVHKLCLSDVIL